MRKAPPEVKMKKKKKQKEFRSKSPPKSAASDPLALFQPSKYRSKGSTYARKNVADFPSKSSYSASDMLANSRLGLLEGIRGEGQTMLQKAPVYTPMKKAAFSKTKKKLERQEPGVEQLRNIKNRIDEILQSEESAPYGRTKLMFVGEGRAGKTSSIKALLNKKFDPAEGSTKGFDVSRVDAKQWTEDEGSYLIEHLQRLLKNDPNQRKNSTIAPTAQGDSAQNEGDAEKSNIKISDEETFKYGKELVIKTDSKDSLSFSIWDFGGQKVFYTLHHLFLTEYGCYVLVVNSRKLLDPQSKAETLSYMRFWLFSKKIHAPSAPILIAGTRSTECSQSEIAKINKIIKREVLGLEKFNEISNGKMSYFPIDNMNSSGVDTLREKIEAVVRASPYTKEEVPVSFLRALQLLLDEKKDHLTLEEGQEILRSCGLTGEDQDTALDFLNKRGLVVYFAEPQELRQFIVLQPQWLIEGLTDIFFDFGEHEAPVFDDKFNREFRKFEFDRILSKALLKNIWDHKEYSPEVQNFFLQILQKSSLICDYKFDNEVSFLVPSLFESNDTKQRRRSVLAMKDEYEGPQFFLDFSGDYDEVIVKDSGDSYVRYLPIGVFERLVCLCIEFSGKMEESVTPKVTANCCQLSFGVDIDFELQIESNEMGSPIRIRVSSESGAEMSEVKELIKKLYTMVEGLKEDFFSNAASDVKLAISLLIPSSKETKEVLADYNKIKEAREKYKLDKKIRPTAMHKQKVKLRAYDAWFLDDSGSESNVKEDLTNPEAAFKANIENGTSLSRGPTIQPLKEGLTYHCFLSYKQQSAIDMVGKQYFILTHKGFKCWYDQQFPGSITLKNMQDGVRDSMCYILFLSKDIFPSVYVEAEVTMALQLNKPIILLHHPDTGSKGYWSFADYINNAPEVVKPLFAKIESIQLQRRYYLEQAVTEEIERRLLDISNNWYK